MIKKKFALLLLLCIGFIALLSFQDPDSEPSDSDWYADQSTYEESPPIPIHFWVQKLADPLGDGSNMILKVEYFDNGAPIPTSLNVYNQDGSGYYTVFHNDGAEPDVTGDDRIFSAYITDDAQVFRDKMVELETALTNRGSFMKFTGHMGEDIDVIPHFDVDAFDNGEEVEVNYLLLNGAQCGAELRKQNSLFITDLSVVEDPARTYNIVNHTGNPYGVWTFGNLMKNMANTAVSGVSTQDFLKAWVAQWVTDQTINGQTVGARKDVITYLIAPWLRRANNNLSLAVSVGPWANIWDTTQADSIIVNSPFKLTAIVNRIDLRGNPAYAANMTDAGETRFIFSLISPYPTTINIAGNATKHESQNTGAPVDNSKGFLDWEGMNVIFEYGNIQGNGCALRDFAQKWFDLSYYTNFGSAYNDSLEVITRTVIDADAAMSRVNHSAIDRVRTNERIFYQTGNSNDEWDDSNWELRQFELDPDSMALKGVPMTNTPLPGANRSGTISYSGAGFPADATLQSNLLNWVFIPIRKHQILLGSFNMPATYTMFPSGNNQFLAGSAQMDAEQLQHLDLNWTDPTPPNYYPEYLNLSGMPTPFSLDDKTLRQQVSVNTCEGCHGGETKTVFTHMRPLGYGETAKYWLDTPDNSNRMVDNLRFNITNSGRTTESPSNVDNYPLSSSLQHYVKVSAFLTGRNYSGNGTFQDDLHDGTEDISDTTMEGRFWVNDPTNNLAAGTLPAPEMKWPYNDLERRKIDLCKFIQTSCGRVFSTNVLNIVVDPAHTPFPIGGH